MCLLNFAENTYKCIKNSTLVEIGESNYPGNRSVHCIYISAFNDFSKHLSVNINQMDFSSLPNINVIHIFAQCTVHSTANI